jgi:hypothetical protein
MILLQTSTSMLDLPSRSRNKASFLTASSSSRRITYLNQRIRSE